VLRSVDKKVVVSFVRFRAASLDKGYKYQSAWVIWVECGYLLLNLLSSVSARTLKDWRVFWWEVHTQ
jgi:hypothetical protein